MSLCICPKFIKHAIPRVSSNVNYGLCVAVMCQCRFISYNKCIALVRDVDGQAIYGGIFGTWSYLLRKFAVILKVLIKKKNPTVIKI